jgi:K+-sensing histidine kinase KdpD
MAAARPLNCWRACPQLPLRELPYRGRTLREFDLDAALARNPDVLTGR